MGPAMTSRCSLPPTPKGEWYPNLGIALTEHNPSVLEHHWCDTGLLAPTGRRILRRSTRPLGFFADPNQTIYIEEADRE